jgi:CBS domain containing-hemolysin-like protein
VEADTGAIVSVISNRDIRIAMKSLEVQSAIHSPLRHFLQAVIAERKSSDSRLPSVTCAPSATLRHVLDVLSATKLHRIVVVDERGVPVSIVSLRDVIAHVVSVPDEGYFSRCVTLPGVA